MADMTGQRGQARPWFLRYRPTWFRFDLLAGLIAAAVVIPKAMAYATVAGLPVQAGLCTALIPMLIYPFLGTSAALSVSTTTTIAILAGTNLQEIATAGDPAQLTRAACTLALMVGTLLMVARTLRLGFLANFISEPVLVGFKAGIAIVIVVDQLPKILGVHLPKGNLLHHLVSLAQAIPEASIPTVLVGALMIILLVVLEHKFPKLPAPLLAVGLGIIAFKLFGLDKFGVAPLGEIPRGLPQFTLPDLTLAEKLWPGALGIALMSFTESIAAARAFTGRDESPIQPNRELLAIGAANLGGAFLGAMPAGGGTTQTAVNRLAGARTQLAQVITACVTLLTMIFFASFIGDMPQATLAAIVIVYSVGLFKPREFRDILKVRRTEFLWALIAISGVILFGTLKGIVVAIIASLMALAYQTADPPVRVLGRKRGTNVFRPLSGDHAEDETFPGLLMVRIEGRIFFANAERVADKVRQIAEATQPQVLALHLRGVPDIEFTALKMLIEAEKRLRDRGVMLWLVGLNPEVLDMVQRSSLGEVLGRERMFYNLELAVEKYQEEVKPA